MPAKNSSAVGDGGVAVAAVVANDGHGVGGALSVKVDALPKAIARWLGKHSSG